MIESHCKLLASFFFFSWEQSLLIDLIELSHCLRFESEGKKQ